MTKHEHYVVPLDRFLEVLKQEFDISGSFEEASDHPYTCTCDKCRDWWRKMGPDPDTDEYGPFGKSIEPEE